jgi:hypothetical protein
MARGGRRPGAGRKRGSLGKVTEERRALIESVLSDSFEQKLWQKYLNHGDRNIAWEAFKLAKAYKSGKPPQPLTTEKPIRVEFVSNVSFGSE